MSTQESEQEHNDEYAFRFVGDPGEMIVDGKIFVNGEWVELEEHRKRLKQKNEK